MKIVRSIADLRTATAALGPVAFVPTMGNLHDGHLYLVNQGQSKGGVTRTLPVVASIFVNRLQFGPNEDFDSYPRTFEADAEKLEKAGCALLFAPLEKDFYPEPQHFTILPDPQIASILEGHFRPGFFSGVCTVVMKLFCAVQPQTAIFGKKDYQQLMVVKKMIEQFTMPINIIGIDTVREPDGLAMSSRNSYLTALERVESARLISVLRSTVQQSMVGETSREAIEAQAIATLQNHGWMPDYVAIRQRHDLLEPKLGVNPKKDSLVVLAAAKLGTTRLIDNLEF